MTERHFVSAALPLLALHVASLAFEPNLRVTQQAIRGLAFQLGVGIAGHFAHAPVGVENRVVEIGDNQAVVQILDDGAHLTFRSAQLVFRPTRRCEISSAQTSIVLFSAEVAFSSSLPMSDAPVIMGTRVPSGPQQRGFPGRATNRFLLKCARVLRDV